MYVSLALRKITSVESLCVQSPTWLKRKNTAVSVFSFSFERACISFPMYLDSFSFLNLAITRTDLFLLLYNSCQFSHLYGIR